MPNDRPNDRIVSFDSEQLILVDDQDREQGYMRKAEAHVGGTARIGVIAKRGKLCIRQRQAEVYQRLNIASAELRAEDDQQLLLGAQCIAKCRCALDAVEHEVHQQLL